MLRSLVITITLVITTDLISTEKTANSVVLREPEYFTNTWAVRIIGGIRKAEGVAKRLGYNVLKKISEGVPDIFLFINQKYPEKTHFAGESITKHLRQQSEVTWAEQQVSIAIEIEGRARRWLRSRIKTSEMTRNYPTTSRDSKLPHLRESAINSKNVLDFNDKFWPDQYYLKDRREDYEGPARDINLAPVWEKHKLFGKGIKVIMIDSGIERKHLDLVDNFDTSLGLDLVDNDKDPNPRTRWWHPYYTRYYLPHGTNCAGIIGMKANNSVCGVGVAPSVTLGAVRLLSMDLRGLIDYKIATAFLFKHVEAHIMSNSWRSPDNGHIMPRMGPLSRAALKIGVTKGRQGRGLIYTFAVGNGKQKGDNCGRDMYAASIYTIPVAACNYRGKTTRYSERCPNIMATSYTASVVPTLYGNSSACTTNFKGTSAATPVVSGGIALLLEAKPKLSWRDVQHLLAWTCQVAPLQDNPVGTWTKNGAGFYFSHDFGFGMLNVNGLVESAKGFQNVGAMSTCVTRAKLNEAGHTGETFCDRVKVEIITDGCEGTPSEVAYLEHVQLTVSLMFPRRGDLQIILTSPSGTEANLLMPRPLDSVDSGIRFWAFDSVMTWGESPKGKWTVLVIGEKRYHPKTSFKGSVKNFDSISKNKKNIYASSTRICYPEDDYALDNSMHIGELNELILTFHGTSGKRMPEHYKAGPRTYDAFTLPEL